MSCPGTLDPPQAQRATRSLFVKFAHDQTDLLIIGLRSETDPPQHLPAALALEGILNALSKATGTSPASPSRAVIKLTPTVALALQAPPHGLSEASVVDLKALLRKFQLTHGTRVAGPGHQRRFAPLAISDGWMFEGAPQFQFRPASPEQRAQAVQAEVERQALRAMSYTARRRYHAGGIRLPVSSSPQQGTIVS